MFFTLANAPSRRLALHSILGVGLVAAIGSSLPAAAAEVRLLASAAIKPAIEALAPDFEKQSGHRLIARYELTPAIPQMIEKGLLQKLNKDLLPNFVNLDAPYIGKPWDKADEYVVCKDWGSAGFLYNTKKITRELKDWNDFFDACKNEASGNCSVRASREDAAVSARRQRPRGRAGAS